MARERNKLAMLAVGLFAAGQQAVEDLIEKASGEEAEPADDFASRIEAANFGEQIENLVELGEDTVDKLVGRIRSDRENFGERLKDAVNDLAASFGLVTREDIEELSGSVSKIEREL